MAKQGLLAQLKPSANTDTVLYSAPINRSASTVLTIANDGTGSAYDVAVKNYDQKFTLDAATYKLHAGDLISSSVVEEIRNIISLLIICRISFGVKIRILSSTSRSNF